MAPVNLSEMTIGERISQRLGKDAGKAFDQIMSDPEIAPYVRVLSPQQIEDGTKSVLDLSSYLGNKLDALELPRAMKGLFLAMHGRLPLRVIAPEATPKRPQEAGLVEALGGLCDAKEALSVKMANADFDVAALRAQTRQIVVLRGLARATVRFTSAVLRNLAVLEDGGFSVLKNAYNMVRSAATADEALWDYLEGVETYLYGSAQAAAESRSKMDAARKEAFTAGQQGAQHAAERKVRDSLADEIVQLSDDLRRSFAPTKPGDR